MLCCSAALLLCWLLCYSFALLHCCSAALLSCFPVPLLICALQSVLCALRCALYTLRSALSKRNNCFEIDPERIVRIFCANTWTLTTYNREKNIYLYHWAHLFLVSYQTSAYGKAEGNAEGNTERAAQCGSLAQQRGAW
jgi:hypothetical protein